MLNSHCNNNDKKDIKKKKKRKKIRWSPRFESRIYGFKDDRGIHYSMEANGIQEK